ncbi:MAG: hypothetical protein ACFFCS_25345 [Candidatus Hodarchaeota archaeon]
MNRRKRKSIHLVLVGVAILASLTWVPTSFVAAESNVENINVKINGQEPGPAFEARLRENFTVSLTWDLSGDEGCGVRFFLSNNATTKIQKSPLLVVNDPGTNITRNWTFSLLPGQWAMEGGDEYGMVEMYFYLSGPDGPYDMDIGDYVIHVLPEQVELSMDDYHLVNGSGGVIEGWSATFSMASVADGAFHHPGWTVFCDIIDDTNQTVNILNDTLDSTGQASFTIDGTYMLELERYNIIVRNDATNHLEENSLFINFTNLFNRTLLLLSYIGKAELMQGGERFIQLSFNASVVELKAGINDCNLIFDWELVNASNGVVFNDSTWCYITEPVELNIPSNLFDGLEDWTCRVKFPGNYLIQGVTFDFPLSTYFSREVVELELQNYDEMMAGTTEALVFLLKTTGLPVNVSNRLVNATWTGTSCNYTSMLVSSATGHITVIPGLDVFEDLESFNLSISVPSTMDYIGYQEMLVMDDLFERHSVNHSLLEFSPLLNADRDEEHVFSGKFINGSDQGNELNGISIHYVLKNEAGATIDSGVLVTGNDGGWEYALPVASFSPGSSLYLELSVHPSFTLQSFSTSISFFVESVYSTRERITNTIMYSSISIAASIFTLVLFTRWKKSRGYLSPKDFWVKVKVE